MDSHGAGMVSCDRAVVSFESQAVSALVTKFLLPFLVKHVIMYIICSIYDHYVNKNYALVVLLVFLTTSRSPENKKKCHKTQVFICLF